ncbi:MAG: hypothetical protein V7K57_17735 [Nostoc sp.]
MLTNNDGTNSVVYQWINDGENRLVGVTTTSASGSSQTRISHKLRKKRSL